MLVKAHLFISSLFAFFIICINIYYEVDKAVPLQISSSVCEAATVATSFRCVHATNDAFKIAQLIVCIFNGD